VTRCIGLDHGTRRIGIAVGDTETGMAFARPALRRRALGADLDALVRMARDEDAAVAIVGLPRNMDGSEGAQAASAREFGERLRERGLRVVYADERLSSWEAGERMAAEGRRPHRSSGELDSAAARLVLQEYLDARRGAPSDAEETE
jgi:putative holliday junction resolvase